MLHFAEHIFFEDHEVLLFVDEVLVVLVFRRKVQVVALVVALVAQWGWQIEQEEHKVLKGDEASCLRVVNHPLQK